MNQLHSRARKCVALVCLWGAMVSASAVTASAQDKAPAPKPRYSLPWGLRPAIAPKVIRSDSSLALTDNGNTFASTLLAGYNFIPNLGAYGRAAVTYNNPDSVPMGPKSATAFSNPILFGLYTPELMPGLRLPVFAGATLPIGAGGGDDPDKDSRAAQGAAIYTRSAMDNALFAVNYFTVTAGVGLAWIHDRLTLQTEVTVLELIRARGKKVEADETRTNFTTGLHAGYAVIDRLTLSAELRYQRWLSEAAPVKANPSARDQMTVGGGARLNLPVGKVTVRPGFAYFHPVDDPMAKGSARVLTFDVPVLF
jgi:hypothetical protein